MANGKIGRELNKHKFKNRQIMSNKYMGCAEDFKNSTEQFSMTFQEYKKKWIKEKRKNNGKNDVK